MGSHDLRGLLLRTTHCLFPRGSLPPPPRSRAPLAGRAEYRVLFSVTWVCSRDQSVPWVPNAFCCWTTRHLENGNSGQAAVLRGLPPPPVPSELPVYFLLSLCISSSLSFTHAWRFWVGAAHTGLCLVGPQLSACVTAAGEASPLGNSSPVLPQSHSPPQMLSSPCVPDKGSRFSLLLIHLFCCSWLPVWGVPLSLVACQSQAGG